MPASVPVPEVVPTNVPPDAGRSATAWHAVQPAAGFPPTQVPLLQTSLVVQELPSLQGALLLAWRQPSCGSQMSSVQGLPSSQFPHVAAMASRGAGRYA